MNQSTTISTQEIEKVEEEFNAKVIKIDMETGIATLTSHDRTGQRVEFKIKLKLNKND